MTLRVVGERLTLAYRELIREEAQLGEALGRRGVRIGATVADQWSTLHDHLHLYGGEMSPAGLVIFAGRPDDASRATGIPFTSAAQAREILSIDARGNAASPASEAFWRALETARAEAADAPIDALLGTVHLAHAQPFDFPPAKPAGASGPCEEEPEVRDAAIRHVLRILEAARPQAAICIGAEALAIVGRAVGSRDLVDLASAPESVWAERWPPGTRMSGYPYAEVATRPPFRMRIAPAPALDGPRGAAAERLLAGAFSYVLV